MPSSDVDVVDPRQQQRTIAAALNEIDFRSAIVSVIEAILYNPGGDLPPAHDEASWSPAQRNMMRVARGTPNDQAETKLAEAQLNLDRAKQDLDRFLRAFAALTFNRTMSRAEVAPLTASELSDAPVPSWNVQEIRGPITIWRGGRRRAQ